MEASEDDKEASNRGEKIGYVADRRLFAECSRMGKVRGRSIMLHTLMQHADLTKMLLMYPLKPVELEDLLVFHSREYVDFLANPKLELEEEFGLGYDCPVLDNMDVFAKCLAAGSLTAADLLLEGRVRVAVNWSGGWHHAKRDAASGFCYVNDIVLAIHRLQRGFKRIMYVDLDVHHGDGVEEAFSSTDKVLTLSLHKMEPGFFPGTGGVDEVGFGRGKLHSVNVPLNDGVDDAMYTSIFSTVFQLCVDQFKPDVFLIQCGADGLAGDPLGGFNLTPSCLSACVLQVVRQGPPVLLLGGGGYNIPNTVRCWTRITADLLGVKLPEDIPDSDPFFLEYGPDYEFCVAAGRMKNTNSSDYVNTLIETIRTNLSLLPVSTS